MIFKYKDYTLEPEVAAPGRYNLYEEAEVINGKTKGTKYNKPKGYGLLMSSAVLKIAELEMMKDIAAKPLKEYAKELKKQRNLILKEF